MFYKVITCDVLASPMNPDVHTHPDWLFDVHAAQFTRGNLKILPGRVQRVLYHLKPKQTLL